jgi:hypothetical protein
VRIVSVIPWREAQRYGGVRLIRGRQAHLNKADLLHSDEISVGRFFGGRVHSDRSALSNAVSRGSVRNDGVGSRRISYYMT